jgi:surfactin synthase thioesterase subunit
MMAAQTLVHFPQPRPNAAVRLFCFPYAGAGVQTYQEFARELPERVEVAGVRLPDQARHMPGLVDCLAGAVTPHLALPAAFFGHSMGAHIAFELARELARRGVAAPQRLLVSGCPAPRPAAADLDPAGEPGGREHDAECGPELPADLTALRADLTVAQTHEYRPGPPLPIPVHAFLGTEDPIAGNEQMIAWLAQTTRYFTIIRLGGDHFFVNSQRAALLSAVATAIGA